MASDSSDIEIRCSSSMLAILNGTLISIHLDLIDFIAHESKNELRIFFMTIMLRKLKQELSSIGE